MGTGFFGGQNTAIQGGGWAEPGRLYVWMVCALVWLIPVSGSGASQKAAAQGTAQPALAVKEVV